AASRVEHVVPGPQPQQPPNVSEFSSLRSLQALVRVDENSGRVRELAVEHQGKYLRVVLVVRGNLAPLVFPLLLRAAAERLSLDQRVRGHRRSAGSRSITMSTRSSTVKIRPA